MNLGNSNLKKPLLNKSQNANLSPIGKSASQSLYIPPVPPNDTRLSNKSNIQKNLYGPQRSYASIPETGTPISYDKKTSGGKKTRKTTTRKTTTKPHKTTTHKAVRCTAKTSDGKKCKCTTTRGKHCHHHRR